MTAASLPTWTRRALRGRFDAARFERDLRYHAESFDLATTAARLVAQDPVLALTQGVNVRRLLDSALRIYARCAGTDVETSIIEIASGPVGAWYRDLIFYATGIRLEPQL